VATASTGRAYCMIQRAEADAADARGHTHSSRASCQQLTNMHIHCKGLGNTVDCFRSLNAVSPCTPKTVVCFIGKTVSTSGHHSRRLEYETKG
jgi:hypothetical protein